jgi:hypothetical protein
MRQILPDGGWTAVDVDARPEELVALYGDAVRSTFFDDVLAPNSRARAWRSACR